MEETKKCKACLQDIPKGAKKCPHCTADQRSWFARHPILTVLLVIFGLPIILASIGSSTPATDTPNNNDTANPASSDQKATTPTNTWKYETKTDEFSGDKQSFATLTSSNELEFEFPYNGGSRFVLIIRNQNDGKGEEVMIKASKGQFLTYDENIKVRFDEGEPVTYSISSSDDGSADVVFIKNPAGFIANLKASTAIKVEAPFYQAGRKVIYFDTAGYTGLE
jgi:hypothetical protein